MFCYYSRMNDKTKNILQTPIKPKTLERAKALGGRILDGLLTISTAQQEIIAAENELWTRSEANSKADKAVQVTSPSFEAAVEAVLPEPEQAEPITGFQGANLLTSHPRRPYIPDPRD